MNLSVRTSKMIKITFFVLNPSQVAEHGLGRVRGHPHACAHPRTRNTTISGPRVRLLTKLVQCAAADLFWAWAGEEAV